MSVGRSGTSGELAGRLLEVLKGKVEVLVAAVRPRLCPVEVAARFGPQVGPTGRTDLGTAYHHPRAAADPRAQPARARRPLAGPGAAPVGRAQFPCFWPAADRCCDQYVIVDSEHMSS
jgi:hypothetical protein